MIGRPALEFSDLLLYQRRNIDFVEAVPKILGELNSLGRRQLEKVGKSNRFNRGSLLLGLEQVGRSEEIPKSEVIEIAPASHAGAI